MDSQYLSVQQVADLLDLHVKTVRRYIAEGRLGHTRIGKRYRVSRADLAAFTGESETGSVAGAPVTLDVSSILTATGVGKSRAERLATTLTAVVNGRRGERPVGVNCVYYPEDDSLKIFISGSAEDSARLIGMADTLLGSGVMT